MRKRILLVDNYDSFTYNLWNYLCINDAEVDVVLNDHIDLTLVESYDGIVLSPGPGIPAEAGLMPELIRSYAGKIPMLGICLGHQALAEAFSGRLERLDQPYHGISQEIIIEDIPIFEQVSNPCTVGLYHSWFVSRVKEPFQIAARNLDNIPMAIYAEALHLTGVQFHPESIMTTEGLLMISNWIKSLK